MRALLLLLCAASVLGAQSPLIERYLELTSSQAAALDKNNGDHEQWRSDKERRINQVKREQRYEINRSPLDPTRLGQQTAEIESICREIDEREKQLIALNRQILTPDQKTKLAALESAMLLIQTANQATQRHLIDSDPIGPLLLVPIGTSYTPTLTKQRTGACAPLPNNTIPAVRLTLP